MPQAQLGHITAPLVYSIPLVQNTHHQQWKKNTARRPFWQNPIYYTNTKILYQIANTFPGIHFCWQDNISGPETSEICCGWSFMIYLQQPILTHYSLSSNTLFSNINSEVHIPHLVQYTCRNTVYTSGSIKLLCLPEFILLHNWHYPGLPNDFPYLIALCDHWYWISQASFGCLLWS